MPNPKPWLSFEDQLTQLKDRGLAITNDAKALEYLGRVGYYRLSGYWYSFRQRSNLCCPLPSTVVGKYKKGKTDRIILDDFKAGASFEKAIDLYVFDKKLRLLVLDAIERIEVALRVDISHLLGRTEACAYYKANAFHSTFSEDIDPKTGITKHHDWLSRQAKLINRSKEGFIKHNKDKYGLPIPIWVACEVWDFGTLSNLYGGLKEADQEEISTKYGIANGRVFATWLRCLNYLRNVSAHHSRLWNRNMSVQPKKPNTGEAPTFAAAWDDNHVQARTFLLLCIAQHLLNRINPTSSWWARVKEHLHTFPDIESLELNLKGMGVIEGWHEWEFDS